MKQQLHTSSYQQLGARKKFDKNTDSSKKLNTLNQTNSSGYLQTSYAQNIADENLISEPKHMFHQQKLLENNLQFSNQGLHKNELINGMTLEEMITQQNNQLQQNYFSKQGFPSMTPTSQTAKKTQKSRSPSYKSGSQIKLQSAQLESIQKQFIKLLEKENKQLNNSNSNSSANKKNMQSQQSAQLAGGGSVTYLSQTKSSAMQRRQRNLTQLNINNSAINNSLNKGNSASVTRINRSLTPNQRTASSSSHEGKSGVSSNYIQFQSGNQTTANITQKHYDFSLKQDPPQQSQKLINYQNKQIIPSANAQQSSVYQQKSLQKNSQMQNQNNQQSHYNSQQSNSSVNGEVINNRLASVIQKNPQSMEEYGIKDKQLNKLLQQLLQQRMKQSQHESSNINNPNLPNQVNSNKNLENSVSLTMSLMSSKPSTLQSYYAHLGLDNNLSNNNNNNYHHEKNSQQLQGANSSKSLQGYSFLNNSTQAGSSTQNMTTNTNQTILNGNQTLNSNLFNSNNPNQNQQNLNQSSLSAQLHARNMDSHNIFQEQLKVEESFQQKYQQFKEKFSTYSSESQFNSSKYVQNNSQVQNQKDNFFQQSQSQQNGQQGQQNITNQEESINIGDSVQASASNPMRIQNQLDVIYEDKHSIQKEEDEEILTEKDLPYNTNVVMHTNDFDNPQNLNNVNELLSPDDEVLQRSHERINNNNQYPLQANPSNPTFHQIGSNMGQMTINTETDSAQLMSSQERENMMQYIENAQFPQASTTYQDMMQHVPSDVYQEIIVIYEEKIKEITDKFQHRDVILRQSLMKLEKENSILLCRLQEQQEEIFRYKKLRDMEMKVIKKLEGEIKAEKLKYNKLFQQKIYKKGTTDKGFNSSLIEELNKKVNDMQQEKECLEYLLKDALLKTELLKAKESVIYRQIPFSNNFNASASTISIGGNQTGSNFNQQFFNNINSNSNFTYSNPQNQQIEYVNLLSLDNSLNRSNNQIQQQQQQHHQSQQQQFLSQHQQFSQHQNIGHLITNSSEDNQSPDKNFLRTRNRSYEGQYFGQQEIYYQNDLENENANNQQNPINNMHPLDNQNMHQIEAQNIENMEQLNYHHQQQNQDFHHLMDQGVSIPQNQLVQQQNEPESSGRSNFMKAYLAQSNTADENEKNSPLYPNNYVLRNSKLNLIGQLDEVQNSDKKLGSYMLRSQSQNSQMLPEDYYYSENDQHEEIEQQEMHLGNMQIQQNNDLNIQEEKEDLEDEEDELNEQLYQDNQQALVSQQ